MKTKFFSIIAATIAIAFTSCNNDDDETVMPLPTPASNGFTWTENDDPTVNTATAASFSTQYKTLIAKDASDATIFEINLDGTTAATYTIGGANALTYTAVTPFFVAESGEVIVTANASGKISGTFSGFKTGTGLTRINGTFTDITVLP